MANLFKTHAETITSLKRSIRNIAVAIASLAVLLPSFTLSAQQTMSLGTLEFVLPNANTTLDSRILRISMSAKDITSHEWGLVGGIAFTQTATPTSKINSTRVYYSSVDSKAHVVFNGRDIIVPLLLFQLQPIVNFANSEDNVVMTRYGKRYGDYNNQEKVEILFHPAFIDNIMGLRLLQVDCLDRLCDQGLVFPIIGDKVVCAPEEEKVIANLNVMMSEYASELVPSIIKGMAETYIYTDVKEPIYFSIESDNSLSFSMKPYFRFAKRKGVYRNDYNKRIDKYSFYLYYRSYCDRMMKHSLNCDPVLRHQLIEGFLKIDGQQDKTLEQKSTELLKAMYDENSLVYLAFVKGLPLEDRLCFSVNNLYNWFPQYKKAFWPTAVLKANPDILRQQNPLVYAEVDNICLWSAVFRYVKAQNPSMWESFVEQVNSIPLPPPAVKTPIAFTK